MLWLQVCGFASADTGIFAESEHNVVVAAPVDAAGEGEAVAETRRMERLCG